MDKKQDIENRKQHIKMLNEPPHLTVLEEVVNAVVHGIGALYIMPLKFE